MLRLLPVSALILAGTLSVAQADVYRWVDEHGEPHYSDQWVPGSQIIKTSKAHPGSDTMSRPSDQKTLAASNQKVAAQIDDQQNSRATQQDVAKTREVQCKAAKDRYQKAIQSRRVYKEGSAGDREYLTDAEADAYRETARKDVQDRCGSVPAFDPNAPIPEPQPIPEPKVNPADATSE
jgi:Domain of unknown function (DUF4124)